MCIYHNRAGHNVIVFAVLRRELPRQGIFSGSQCFDLAYNFRQALGVVSAEDQLQLAHKIALGVGVAVYGHFHRRVSLCHQEMQSQVCGVAVFRGKCKGHVLAVRVRL